MLKAALWHFTDAFLSALCFAPLVKAVQDCFCKGLFRQAECCYTSLIEFAAGRERASPAPAWSINVTLPYLQKEALEQNTLEKRTELAHFSVGKLT